MARRGCECTDENTHIYGNIGWGEVVKGGWWVIGGDCDVMDGALAGGCGM